METSSELQKDFQDESKLFPPTRTEVLSLNVKVKTLQKIASYSAFKITICFVSILSLGMICCAMERKPVSAISIYSKNTYYFQDSKGKPFMFIWDYSFETFSGVDFDFVKMFDSLKSRCLNQARIWLWWGCEELLPP